MADTVIDLTTRRANPGRLAEHDAPAMDDPESGEFDLGAPTLAAAIEALLLIADEPMSAEFLASVVNVTVDEVVAEIDALRTQYATAGRGFALREESVGWRFVTSPTCSDLISRFVKDGQTARLSQAALETLAVVAYRQPVSRTRISAIRGVNVDGVMRTLTNRGLVTEVGHDPDSGAVLYATTEYFLQRLGISSLDDLPPVADYLPDLADVDSPELAGDL